MDPYSLENALNLDSFDCINSTSNQQHQSSDSSGESLSPLTLTRLQESWHTSQDRSKSSDNDQQGVAGNSDADPIFTADTKDLPADFDFSFLAASPSRATPSTDPNDPYTIGRNTLGLLQHPFVQMSPLESAGLCDTFGPTNMNHSHSASGILDSTRQEEFQAVQSPLSTRKQSIGGPLVLDQVDASPAARQIHRSLSVSSPPAASNRHGSISNFQHFSEVQDPSRQDFSTGQSPKSSSEMPPHMNPNTPQRQPVFGQQQLGAGQNSDFLAITQGHFESMGPPASRGPALNLAKRGLFNHHGEDQPGGGPEGEPTPLASSMGTFDGHRPVLGSLSTNPSTPLSHIHRQNLFNSTPGSSISYTTTPENFDRDWANISPFTPADRPSLQRMHSVHGSAPSQQLVPSTHPFSQPLENFWSDEDDKSGLQSRIGGGMGASASQDGTNGGLSLFHRRAQQNAMTRVTSAPALAPLSIATMGAVHSSVPSTPSDCPPGSAVSWTSSIPSTPGDGGLSLSPAFGGAGMSHSRSLGGMPSMMSPVNVSSLSLHDGSPLNTPGRGSFSDPRESPTQGKGMIKGRSNSKSTGSTPRKPGGRTSAGVPPLVVSSADKVHVCHCGKRFKRMEHLKRHNRTHTQERPHKCHVEGCGKYFGRTDNLAQHLKTHQRASGMARASQQLYAMTNVSDGPVDFYHDPHAAASQAAATAVAAAQGKRRSSTISHAGGTDASVLLGGPISLTKQGPSSYTERSVLTSSASANASPAAPYTMSPSPFQA